ncbi:MAG: ATP-binding protein [Selenomonadaceae bacterium]|nr:ATP-binding protein [Selenomonadaceae bacterium]
MEKLTIDAKIENLPSATEFVTQALENSDCPMKVIMQMELVIEEIFVNVANYAYAPETGSVTICRDFEENPRTLCLTFIDGGKSHNPLEHADPDITLAAEDRDIGGLGIFLVKKNVDEISYKYEDGKNILSVKKFF